MAFPVLPQSSNCAGWMLHSQAFQRSLPAMKGLYELLPAKLSTGILSHSAHVSSEVTSEVEPFSLFNLICVFNKAIKGNISARCESFSLKQ